jgi:light-regulated signal transduction histidine kinase (bacteriophytochrome)/CheY-like chemotaxis protein
LEKPDLTNCDREPIHLLGKVQSFGFLLAVTPDWIISHVSENLDEFLPWPTTDLLGRPAATIIPAATIHAIRNRLQFLQPFKGAETVYGVSFTGFERKFDVSIHVSGRNIVLEFETATAIDGAINDAANVRLAIERMGGLSRLDDMYAHATRFVKALTGFDRVMFYRFEADNSGKVVAETKNAGMTPYLNLRYPASDIPKQARALYLENPIRIIADAHDDGVPVQPHQPAENGLPMDLSGSRLRSVSPIHLEYLRNMGVGASMSISVIVDGALWGLIACHHNSAFVPDMRQRNSALLFGQMLSLVLQARINAEEKAIEERLGELTSEISGILSSNQNAPGLLQASAESFCSILNADGFAVVQGKSIVGSGLTPDNGSMQSLCAYLASRDVNGIFSSNKISDVLQDWDGSPVAGVLAIPISREPRDHLLFFRPELVQTVEWAGDPEKPVTPGPNGVRLSPRKSFEAWKETIRDQSEPWSSTDLKAASKLRVVLLEVVLRLADEASRERKEANESKELLIAELNHRVRNILGLVRGLISQSETGAATTEEFVGKLDRRVQALARAHDQITRHNWSAASVSQLIETEAESYHFDSKDRVEIAGQDVLLKPQAYAGLALVIHEMITNSVKYGALSGQAGKVDIGLEVRETGNLAISWRETGGPPVETPKRRGFGSTIIERAIPFELKGKSEIAYDPQGVRALFEIPGTHVFAGKTGFVAPSKHKGTEPVAFASPKSVLIVEDNLIIAMDAEAIFTALGSENVTVVASVDAAISEVETRSEPYDFAMLDINLGVETSFPVALELRDRGVPFIFASGYGEDGSMPEEVSNVLVVSKPYDKDIVAEAINSLQQG